MRKIALLVEYEGTPYHGWQRQPGKPTIQALLEEALSKITREKISVMGASRTDAGVHALGQVAHFVTHTGLSERRIWGSLNRLLPKQIRIRHLAVCAPDFHANRDAVSKVYVYRIWNHEIGPALLHDRVWHVRKPLDFEKIRKASTCLLGTHDFSSFRGSGSSVKSSVRRIDRLLWKSDTPPLWLMEIEGDGFLRNMVRNLVGTLVEIGKGRQNLGEMENILLARDRGKAGIIAPARGLYLMEVRYTRKS